MPKATIKWIIPDILKFPSSVKQLSAPGSYVLGREITEESCKSPLFHCVEDEGNKWQLELASKLNSTVFKPARKDLECRDERRFECGEFYDYFLSVGLVESVQRIGYRAAKYSIFVYDEINTRVVFQKIIDKSYTTFNHPDRCSTVTIGHDKKTCKIGTQEEFMKLSTVSISCTIEYDTGDSWIDKSSPKNLLDPCSSIIETYRNSTLSKELERVLTNQIRTDIVFYLTDDCKEFKAHKMMLCARSPVLAAMFDIPMKENITNRVEIQDIPSEIFEALLRFIYTDRIDINEENVGDLLAAADRFIIPLLKTNCEEFIYSGQLTEDNYLESLVLADIHNAPHLKKKVIEFIRFHQSTSILKTDLWKKLKVDHPNFAVEVTEAILGV